MQEQCIVIFGGRDLYPRHPIYYNTARFQNILLKTKQNIWSNYVQEVINYSQISRHNSL